MWLNVIYAVHSDTTTLVIFANNMDLMWESVIFSTDICRLTTGILSEKCVVRRFRRCANVLEFTYTNLDSIAHYTPRPYGTAYCS